MGYGKGYYDRCCCNACKTSCGQLTFAIVQTILVITSGIFGNFVGLILDIGLVIWLFTSYKRRDDDHGIKGVNTAKGAFIYSTVLCVLSAIGQLALFIICLVSWYITDELAFVFLSVCWGTTIRIWQTIVAFWFYASLRDDYYARQAAKN